MLTVSNRRWQGVGAVLIAGTGYALMSILVKLAYRLSLNPQQVIALQSWIASLILLIYMVALRRKDLILSLRTLGLLVLQGLVGALGTSLFYANSLIFLPVSVAILLLYLYPAFVLAAGVIIWRKKVSRQELAAFFLTLTGTGLASGILAGIGQIAWFGIVLGLAGALCYASFNIIGEIALAKVSPLVAMCYTQWSCALALLVVMKGDVLSIPWQNVQIWEIGLLLATLSSIIPFYLILVGIQQLGADQAAILSTFELPMTFIMAAIFLKEFPSVHQWIGGGLVMSGILLLNWRIRLK